MKAATYIRVRPDGHGWYKTFLAIQSEQGCFEIQKATGPWNHLFSAQLLNVSWTEAEDRAFKEPSSLQHLVNIDLNENDLFHLELYRMS